MREANRLHLHNINIVFSSGGEGFDFIDDSYEYTEEFTIEGVNILAVGEILGLNTLDKDARIPSLDYRDKKGNMRMVDSSDFVFQVHRGERLIYVDTIYIDRIDNTTLSIDIEKKEKESGNTFTHSITYNGSYTIFWE